MSEEHSINYRITEDGSVVLEAPVEVPPGVHIRGINGGFQVQAAEAAAEEMDLTDMSAEEIIEELSEE